MGWFDALRRSLFSLVTKQAKGTPSSLATLKVLRRAENLTPKLVEVGEATTPAGQLEMQIFITRHLLLLSSQEEPDTTGDEHVEEVANYLQQSAKKLGLKLSASNLTTVYRERIKPYDREVNAIHSGDTREGAALVFSYVSFYKEPLENNQQYFAIRANYLHRELKVHDAALKKFLRAIK